MLQSGALWEKTSGGCTREIRSQCGGEQAVVLMNRCLNQYVMLSTAWFGNAEALKV